MTDPTPATVTLTHFLTAILHIPLTLHSQEEHSPPWSGLDAPHHTPLPEVPVRAKDLTDLSSHTGMLEHEFSAPVAILIILGVMAGIIGIILLISYSIGQIIKKRSVDIQPPEDEDQGVPLSSIEQTVNQEFANV
ncbi:rCG51636 [Rattus norvegicus]|uniref:Glycophorin-A n=1 Tax=Rattus norvegicus TaxID=10116 RepID=A6IYH5_RAT|nr:rCG51636 [Rattus norvegicus]